jgi:uncharacterized protein (TIGR02246 family)
MRQLFLISVLILPVLNVQAQKHKRLTSRDATTSSTAGLTYTAVSGAVQSPGSQGPSRVSDDLEIANLAKVSEQWARAWSAKQLDKVIELYAPDAVFLTGTGDRITGRAAIRTAFKTALETITSKLEVRSIITEASGNLAYDSGDYRETITPVSGGTKLQHKGNYVIVFKRQADGKWLIIEHVWTDAPAADK